jgi:hypothetical protein
MKKNRGCFIGARALERAMSLGQKPAGGEEQAAETARTTAILVDAAASAGRLGCWWTLPRLHSVAAPTSEGG